MSFWTVESVRRYASFIATSNHTDLLSDPSGSRRFGSLYLVIGGEILLNQPFLIHFCKEI